MADLDKVRLFRMTHIDNIAHISKHGITHVHSAHFNPAYMSIGDNSLITDRFTDGHALSGLSNFYDSNSVKKIESLIDRTAIATKYWKADSFDTDLKRRKEAEFLVADDLPITAIDGYVVYSEEAKSKLLLLDILESKIFVRDNFYF